MEATILVEFVHRVLTHPVDESQGQRRILPQDLLIVSPYSGQIQLIEKKLLEKAIPGLKISDLKLKTTAQAQGSEASIALVSLVRNNSERPLDLGLVTKDDLLNVMMSRAKHWLLVFGNFQSWMSEYYNSKSTLHYSKGYLARFCSLLKNLNNKGDFVTGPHFRAALTDQEIQGPNFLDLFQDQTKADKSRASIGYSAWQAQFRISKRYRARGGRGGRSGRGGLRGRGDRGGRGGSGGEASSTA